MHISKPIFSFLFILLFVTSFAQTTKESTKLPQLYEKTVENINNEKAEEIKLNPKDLVEININRLKTDPVLKNADWGFVVYDPGSNKILCSYNEEKALVPASTTKLLTTDTALDLLGSKFRWNTQLEYAGNITDEGTLEGNLYIIGSGDPTLGTGKAGSSSYGALINDFIYALVEQNGIKKINGDIIIQNAIYKENKMPFLPKNIVWMEQFSYFIPVGTTENIEPRNEKLITTSKNPFKESKKYFYESPYIHKIVFADQFVSSPFTTKLVDPPYYLANALKKNLISKKISITGKVYAGEESHFENPRKVIFKYQSPLLYEIVIDTNKRSDNSLAEALLRTVGYQKYGDYTLESGRRVVNEHLAEVKFDSQDFHFYDGSGLSRSNKVKPISQVKFLTSVMKKKYFKDYYESLPIAGQDGTLKKMFLNTNAYGNVHAKTGTLNKVKTLAGYITTHKGKTLVFSILINNYAGSVSQVKDRMEQLIEPILDL